MGSWWSSPTGTDGAETSLQPHAPEATDRVIDLGKDLATDERQLEAATAQ